MGLRFILGRAGAGKTYRCLTEIKEQLPTGGEQGPPLVFLVPEQATFQMEKALLQRLARTGTRRAHILSFRRLAWHVFLLTGGGARVPIGEMGKFMALRLLLRKYANELQVFSRLDAHPGLIRELGSTLSELHAYNISPADIGRCRNQVDDGRSRFLGQKIHDLSILYTAYTDFLSQQFTDPEDYLTRLAEKLWECDWIAGASIWVDGFAGFTPQEYRVLTVLLKRAHELSVALCLDPGMVAGGRVLCETDLFHQTWETYTNLRNLAEESGNEVSYLKLEDDAHSRRFKAGSGLAHLEACFDSYPPARFSGRPGDIRIVAADDPRTEVEAAARYILHLCRDRGLRFREIAVILRDLTAYRDLISSIFSDYGIPLFIDERKPATHHPLVQLIHAVLEVVEDNWSYTSVFRALKTDLFPLERDDVDILENYVLACGIRGKRWLDASIWRSRRYLFNRREQDDQREYKDLADESLLNCIRGKVAGLLGEFYYQMTGNGPGLPVRHMLLSLYGLLDRLGVAGRLSDWRQEAKERGDLDLAQEHEQAWVEIMDVFDQCADVMGDVRLSVSEFHEVLTAGLDNLQLRMIPPSLDQVLVGAVDRSRQPEIRAALVLGVNDGVFPASIHENPMFNDDEREQLQKLGVELSPGTRRCLFNEQYLAYVALTRASDFLWVSYAQTGSRGRPKMPSPVIRHLVALFPDLDIESLGADSPSIVEPKRAIGALARHIQLFWKTGEIDDFWLDYYDWVLKTPGMAGPARSILASISYTNNEDRLPPELVASLYGMPLSVSVTRLEQFAACPFRQLAGYGLRLKERETSEVRPPEMGMFFHTALQRLIGEWDDKQDSEPGDVTWEQMEARTQQICADLLAQLRDEVALPQGRYRALGEQLQGILLHSVRFLYEHDRRGSFGPAAVEAGFGPGGTLPALALKVGSKGEAYLNGKIDRVDLLERGNRVYVRVIDYKTYQTTFPLVETWHGLALQLALYLVAARQWLRQGGKEVVPAGAFYFPIHYPIINAEGPLSPAELERESSREMEMKGLVYDDPGIVQEMVGTFTRSSDLVNVIKNKDGSLRKSPYVVDEEHIDVLLQHAADYASHYAEEILSGRVDIRPYIRGNSSGCRYCPYRDACHFDPSLAGNEYRTLPVISVNEVWSELYREDG